jgi:hypothetical protein
MESRYVMAKVSLGMLYLAGVVGLVAQKWTAGAVVLGAAVLLTFPLAALDRRYRNRQPGTPS